MTSCSRVMLFVLILDLASMSMQNADGARLLGLGATPDMADVPCFTSTQSKRPSTPPSGPSDCSSSRRGTNCPPSPGFTSTQSKSTSTPPSGPSDCSSSRHSTNCPPTPGFTSTQSKRPSTPPSGPSDCSSSRPGTNCPPIHGD